MLNSLSSILSRDYHLGLPKSSEASGQCGELGQQYSFSPHVVCEKGEEERPEGTIVISLSRACMCVLRCLKDEKDWSVLGLVLECLPGALQNKGLLSRYGNNLSMFASALCKLFFPTHSLPTINTPAKFGRPEFHCAIYPVLAALASYNKNLSMYKLQENRWVSGIFTTIVIVNVRATLLLLLVRGELC